MGHQWDNNGTTAEGTPLVFVREPTLTPSRRDGSRRQSYQQFITKFIK